MIEVKLDKETLEREVEMRGDTETLYEELVGLSAATFCTILAVARGAPARPWEAEGAVDEFLDNVRRTVMALLDKADGEEIRQ